MNTIQSYVAEDKKNGFSNSIKVGFDRLHDNPNYKKDIGEQLNETPASNTGWHPPMVAPLSTSATPKLSSFILTFGIKN